MKDTFVIYAADSVHFSNALGRTFGLPVAVATGRRAEETVLSYPDTHIFLRFHNDAAGTVTEDTVGSLRAFNAALAAGVYDHVRR